MLHHSADDAWHDFLITHDETKPPVATQAHYSYYNTTGIPADTQQYLDAIRAFVWNWFDANRERRLATFKVFIFNFTLKVKHCEALIELILGERA